jgi:hypothetical protein
MQNPLSKIKSFLKATPSIRKSLLIFLKTLEKMPIVKTESIQRLTPINIIFKLNTKNKIYKILFIMT